MNVQFGDDELYIILSSRHEIKRLLDILGRPQDTTQEEVFAQDLIEQIKEVLPSV